MGRESRKGVHGAGRAFDVFDAKGAMEAVLAALGAPGKVQVRRGGGSWWHPGRHGVVTLGPKAVLAEFGELHPRVLKAFEDGWIADDFPTEGHEARLKALITAPG